MSSSRRLKRLNSLLTEVLSDVIRKDVDNPHVSEFVSVTSVDITSDLHHAKVYVSVIGSQQEKTDTLSALQSASKYISMLASKKVVMRYFPSLTFKLDETVEKQIKIDTILQEIKQADEKKLRTDDA